MDIVDVILGWARVMYMETQVHEYVVICTFLMGLHLSYSILHLCVYSWIHVFS
jgi:hypothetical protein